MIEAGIGGWDGVGSGVYLLRITLFILGMGWHRWRWSKWSFVVRTDDGGKEKVQRIYVAGRERSIAAPRIGVAVGVGDTGSLETQGRSPCLTWLRKARAFSDRRWTASLPAYIYPPWNMHINLFSPCLCEAVTYCVLQYVWRAARGAVNTSSDPKTLRSHHTVACAHVPALQLPQCGP